MASWDGLREGALGQRPRQEGAGRLLCVPTWRHRKAWKPDSPPALLQAVIPLRPRRALRRLVPHVPVAAPMASVSEGRWTGEEAPVLSECGSWGSVEPGSIFSSVEPERVPKLPLVSHSKRHHELCLLIMRSNHRIALITAKRYEHVFLFLLRS